jgi:hypothetical protein
MINAMIIEFLDGANRTAATHAQLEVYDLLQTKLHECREVALAELLEPLGLTDPRLLISRIKHLAEKGFLQLIPETDDEKTAIA